MTEMTSISIQVEKLVQEQVLNWSMASRNYQDLDGVKTRNIRLSGGSEVMVQFNAGRIRSSAAKVDAVSIKARACFLCEANRPIEQRQVTYGMYSILLNPFPIFRRHLTIPLRQHQDQLIQAHIIALLDLAKDLQGYSLFYNGPKCGASAPDHFHFQAGNKGFMPIEADYRSGLYSKLLTIKNGVEVYTWEKYNRGLITIRSATKLALKNAFESLYLKLAQLYPGEAEPMLNLVCYYENECWVLHCMPRQKHRPDCYFQKGDMQILLSPASVDLSGVFIVPREADFNKLKASDIENILSEVCLSTEKMDTLIQEWIKA